MSEVNTPQNYSPELQQQVAPKSSSPMKWILLGVGLLVGLPIVLFAGAMVLLIGIAMIGASAETDFSEVSTGINTHQVNYSDQSSSPAVEFSKAGEIEINDQYDPFNL